jgi:hypothetical protein
VVVLVSRVLRCVRSWGDYSVGTSEYEKWFGGVGRIVYEERVVTVGGFPFFSLYSFSCLVTNTTTLEIPSSSCRVLLCLVLSRTNNILRIPTLRNTLHPCRLRSTPPVTAQERVKGISGRLGLTPENAKMVHIAAVQSVALYGSELWWNRQIGRKHEL